MKKEDLAAMLDGRQYRDEISTDVEYELQQNKGLVVVFGASDDLMEFRGAIYDGINCYDGGTASIVTTGLVVNECDDEDCQYFKKIVAMAVKIEAIWDKDGFSWIYKTKIPHSTFVIMDDVDQYCRGIVFNLSDVKDVDGGK